VVAVTYLTQGWVAPIDEQRVGQRMESGSVSTGSLRAASCLRTSLDTNVYDKDSERNNEVPLGGVRDGSLVHVGHKDIYCSVLVDVHGTMLQ
jgi:hypothetical protein